MQGHAIALVCPRRTPANAHTLLTHAPPHPQGAMDASNLLKPMLSRGELRCIGATTLDEYRKYIEKDPALERRFQQVRCCPPFTVLVHW